MGRLLAYLLAAAMSMLAADGPRLALSETVIDSGGKALIYITLTTAGEDIAGLQFDIQYPTAALSGYISTAYGANSAAKRVWMVNRGAGVWRVLVVGQNQTPIADGPVVAVLIQMKAGAPIGVHPVLITAVSAADTGCSTVAISESVGAVIVPDAGMNTPIVRSAANGASWVSGGVAPGEVVVVEGDSLASDKLQLAQLTAEGFVGTLLDETRVLFDGIAAPLLYASAKQVSAVVPYAIERQTETSVQVERRGVQSVPMVLPVLRAAPGIFTLNGTGKGQGAILNEDGAINGPARPAARGSTIVIYATGEGQTSPPGVDGRIVPPEDLRRPVAPVTVTIGGESAEVLYAGTAGYQVSGLFQVNARIPAGVTPGDQAPIFISVGGVRSQSGATMAVR